MKRWIALVLCLACLALPALAEDGVQETFQQRQLSPSEFDSQPRTLTVNGSAVVSVQPDYAVLTIGAVTKAKTVEEAQQHNAALIESILAAVKAQGVEEQDIATENFSLSVLYDYNNGRLVDERQQLAGYQVENMLTLTVRDLAAVSTVLEAGMNAGANQSYGVTFGASTQGEAADRALQAAVADGMRRAQLMADAAGVTLDTLVSVTESQYVSNTYRGAEALDAAAGTPILSSNLEIPAGVTLTYTVK